jgi:hypothetical protein
MKLRTKRVEEWITIEGDNPEEKAEFLVHPLTPKETSELLEKANGTKASGSARSISTNSSCQRFTP